MGMWLTTDNQRDIVEWDIINWSRAIRFWETKCEKPLEGVRVLDIGSRGGGLSLLFALQGAQVVCSDLQNPESTASPLHRRYGVEDRISYTALDATALYQENAYDFICFKSVIGGVGHHDNKAAQQQMIDNILRALKPDGRMVFAENLTAAWFHQFLRRHFNAWTYWRYVTVEEVLEFCHAFSKVDYRCFGFLGTLGRSEGVRGALGKLDSACDGLLPERWKYIISVVAEK